MSFKKMMRQNLYFEFSWLKYSTQPVNIEKGALNSQSQRLDLGFSSQSDTNDTNYVLQTEWCSFGYKLDLWTFKYFHKN